MDSPEVIFADLLRLFGRVGFVFLVIGIYRVYTLLASPLFKKESRGFVIMFVVALILSFILTVADFLTTLGWLQGVSMGFNVASMYVLAIYLNYQASKVRITIGTEEYNQFSNAMDALIYRLKSK